MKREQIPFHREWYDLVRGLPKDVREELLMAMLDYAFEEVEPGSIGPMAGSMFNIIKPRIASSNRRYRNGCKGGKPNSRLDSRLTSSPNLNSNLEHNLNPNLERNLESNLDTNLEGNLESGLDLKNEENGNKSSKNGDKSSKNGKKTAKSGNIAEKRSINDAVKESSPHTPHKENNNINNINSTEKNKEKKPLPKGREKEEKAEEIPPDGGSKKGRLSLPSQSERLDYQGLKEYFNFTFKDILAQITMMTDARKAAVKARVSEHGKESIKAVFRKVLASPFLLGSNDRNWRADFDWIFKPTNYIKILEGKYDNKGNSTTRTSRNESVGRLKDLAGAILTGYPPEEDQ